MTENLLASISAELCLPSAIHVSVENVESAKLFFYLRVANRARLIQFAEQLCTPSTVS